MSKLIQAYGIQFSIPDTWSVRVFPPRVDGDEYWGLNMHGASLAMPLDDSSTYGSAMMGALGPLDLGFTMTESLPHEASGVVPGKGRWNNARPTGLTQQHFNPATLQATRPGQMGLQHTFTINGRLMELYAVLGSIAAIRSNLDAFNAVLASFQAASGVDATDFAAA